MSQSTSISGYDADSESPSRSVLMFPKNSYIEISQWTRERITLKARALIANLPIMGQVQSTIARQAIGRGVFLTPATLDKEWNELTKSLWEEWSWNPAVYSIDASRDLYQDQLLSVEDMIGDGDAFRLKVLSENGAPMIQAFDSLEVGSRYGDKTFFDGVRTNAYGRPIQYLVAEFEQTGQKKERVINAHDMIHVYWRKRARQLRGLSWFHSAINRGIDCLDLMALITGTAKLHSGLAVTVSGGAAKAGGTGAFGAIARRGAGASAPTNDTAALESIYGGGLISYLQEGGEVKLLHSDRPSENLMEFVRMLYAEIAMALKLPVEVVTSLAPLGGASLRGSLEGAQWLFDLVQDFIVWRHTYPIYLWRISHFVKAGLLRPCKDPEWYKVTHRGPAKMTVDAGRSAITDLKLIQANLMSIDRYYEVRGLDAKTEIRSNIEMEKFIQDERERVFGKVEGGTASDGGPSPIEQYKTQSEAFGTGVRSGAITPSREDEVYFRALAGLPAISQDVARAWDEDNGIRRPITLLQKEATPVPQPTPEEE